MNRKKLKILIIALSLILSSCSILSGSDPASTMQATDATTTQSETLTPIPLAANTEITATPFQPAFEPKDLTLYWSPSVPQEWVRECEGVQIAVNPLDADLLVTISLPDADYSSYAKFTRVFVVGVAFPTVTDGISLADLLSIWSGGVSGSGEFAKLVLTDNTKAVFTEMWGIPAETSVQVLPSSEIVNQVWSTTDTLAILPFEAIEPKLKILRVEGISPLDRPMNTADYPLTILYTLAGNENAFANGQTQITQLITDLPGTNRDETKMTVVVTSGTTALARVTLWKIDSKGIDYPIDLVKGWFQSADLRHVSNEVSFLEECEYTDAYTMQFCSKPEHIQVLEALGVNVVELTGNHMKDYGTSAFIDTIKMYEDRGWLIYGGGYTLETARQAVTTEINGNRIAFVGCNSPIVGPETIWATETKAGAAKCDYDWLFQEIARLKSEGYVVFTTYQDTEIDLPMYDAFFRIPFQEAAKAGADVVQGSQAHVPMGFEFEGNSLIHYGLGNFLFDQMEPNNIREFIDRHIVYDGRYINTVLLTATLTDWSKPVPMSESERQTFLDEMFTASEMR